MSDTEKTKDPAYITYLFVDFLKQSGLFKKTMEARTRAFSANTREVFEAEFMLFGGKGRMTVLYDGQVSDD